jgi:HPt (histidine-containing phosphotransfer) domain-containing protein
MAVELDLSRLVALRQLLGSELPEIVETLVEELRRALSAIATALDDGDLATAALAAHAARNSALMIDARPLLDALDALESSARRNHVNGARQAHRRLDEAWPPLRSQLQRAAANRP